MKIFSTQQMKELDRLTIQKKYSNSWELMENASTEIYKALLEQNISPKVPILFMCGCGNNGGDGLAVARMMAQKYSVQVFLLQSENYSSDNIRNQELLAATQTKIHFFELHDTLQLPTNAIYIDALFGSGLNRALEPALNNIFKQIKTAQPKKIFAIDMPSGLLDGYPMSEDATCLSADLVFTLQSPKLSLLLPQNQEYAKDFKVLEIGLDKESIAETPTNIYYIKEKFIKKLLKSPNVFAHKGTFGYVLIVGGNYGSIGAPILSTKAALKTGCGLVTCAVPKCGYEIVQTSFPEAMCMADESPYWISKIPQTSNYNAIAIGMGLGRNEATQNALLSFLMTSPTIPLVLDADALNILSETNDPFHYIPKGSVLTPHPKELERLVGTWTNDYEKIEKVRKIAKQYQIIILIKGAFSTIICPDDNIYFNSTGNWGMATGGSGDVLSGMIASLLAQGYTPITATILGVYLHGLSGDIASSISHPHSLIASDIIEHIGYAYKQLDNL